MKKIYLIIIVVSLIGFSMSSFAKNTAEDATRYSANFDAPNANKLKPEVCTVTDWVRPFINVDGSGECRTKGYFLVQVDSTDKTVISRVFPTATTVVSKVNNLRCAKPIITCKYSNQP